ncbi:S1C family serine protease [Chloroflexota bacterium]
MDLGLSSKGRHGFEQEPLMTQFPIERGWRQNSGRGGLKKVMIGLVSAVIAVLLIGTGVMAAIDWGPFDAETIDLVGEQPPYVDEGAGVQLNIIELVDRVGPAVVSIVNESVSYDLWNQAIPQTGAGTGVIISPDGWIVTNNHVVEDARRLTVTLSNGEAYEAIRVTTDPENDLAVVKIHADDLPYLHLLNNSLEQLHELDPVVAVGNALALPGGPTWTTGVISNLGRSLGLDNGVVLYDTIQTDAAINRGNSGGPLVNMSGQVVGINVAIASNAENIGFAISTNTAIPVIMSLIEEGKIVRPWLGVIITTVTSAHVDDYNLFVDEGALVVEIFEDSPAEEAGLMPEDVVTGIDGQKVSTSEELIEKLQAREIGDEIEISYFRGDEQRTTTATLAQALH